MVFLARDSKDFISNFWYILPVSLESIFRFCIGKKCFQKSMTFTFCIWSLYLLALFKNFGTWSYCWTCTTTPLQNIYIKQILTTTKRYRQTTVRICSKLEKKIKRKTYLVSFNFSLIFGFSTLSKERQTEKWTCLHSDSKFGLMVYDTFLQWWTSFLEDSF